MNILYLLIRAAPAGDTVKLVVVSLGAESSLTELMSSGVADLVSPGAPVDSVDTGVVTGSHSIKGVHFICTLPFARFVMVILLNKIKIANNQRKSFTYWVSGRGEMKNFPGL